MSDEREAPDCPGHGPGTGDEPDFCDGSCAIEDHGPDPDDCPGHGYVTEDGTGDLDFCDGSCREEEMHARLMAGLLGIDLNDRYPRGDENGIIHAREW